MNIFLFLLPLVTTIIVVILKNKLVRFQSGKEFALKELFIDVVRFVVVYMLLIISNFILGIHNFSAVVMLIDSIMLVVFLLTLLQKNYDFSSRKALSGIMASLLMLTLLGITFFKMITGTYDNENTALPILFLKTASYYFIALWSVFAAEAGAKSTLIHKIKNLFLGIRKSFENRNVGELDYYFFAFTGLFLFVGDNNHSFIPVAAFGIHEIMQRKNIKGLAYIVIGIIILMFKHYLIGQVAFTVYTAFALVDLLIHFIRSNKRESTKLQSPEGENLRPTD